MLSEVDRYRCLFGLLVFVDSFPSHMQSERLQLLDTAERVADEFGLDLASVSESVFAVLAE